MILPKITIGGRGEFSQIKPNAHENIDKEILLESLKRIRHSASGNWMEGLFEATTKGGEKRNIHRKQSRYPNKEAWQDMTLNLMQQIKENPSFSDTLSQEQMPDVVEGMEAMDRPNILMRLLSKLTGG